MPRITVLTRVRAPVERVFDLSRSIDLHMDSQQSHGEKAIAGRTSGLIELGEEVTWSAVHYGIRQNLTSCIVQMQRPWHFRDAMVRGAFKRFDHDHFFESIDSETIMTDVFDYTSPFGWLGRLVDHLHLENYMRDLLAERNQLVKAVAEGEGWQKFLKS